MEIQGYERQRHDGVLHPETKVPKNQSRFGHVYCLASAALVVFFLVAVLLGLVAVFLGLVAVFFGVADFLAAGCASSKTRTRG